MLHCETHDFTKEIQRHLPICGENEGDIRVRGSTEENSHAHDLTKFCVMKCMLSQELFHKRLRVQRVVMIAMIDLSSARVSMIDCASSTRVHDRYDRFSSTASIHDRYDRFSSTNECP